MKRNILPILIYTYALVVLLSTNASAASLKPTILESKDGVTTIGVMVDTEGQKINAMSGTLQYDTEIFRVQAIRTTDSVISFWVDRPTESTVGSITWSGVIPGGFDGVRNALTPSVAPGLVFKILLTPRTAGTGTISLHGIDIRLHDGEATPVVPTIAGLTVSVDDRYIGAVVPRESVATVSEVNLVATLIHDQITTQDKWAAAFSADANRVTIDHYEVAETYRSDPALTSPSAWQKVESPYILRDQFRSHYVHIRAIAQNGEVYVVTIAPIDFSTAATWFTWSILILIVGAIVFAIVRRLAKRKNN